MQRQNYENLCADSTLAIGVDPKYLLAACDLLVEARRDLKWTYAAAFFLKTSPEKNFFEFLQGDLEQDVELLQKLIEYDVPGLSSGYEARAVHKTQTTSRMNGVRQKLANLEFHAAQDFATTSGVSGAVAGTTSDLLDRRRRRTRKGAGPTVGRQPTRSAQHAQGAGRGEDLDRHAKLTCAQCTYENDTGSTQCEVCGLPLAPRAGDVPGAATCPEWATPCRDGKSCAKHGDNMHMLQYWHPPA